MSRHFLFLLYTFSLLSIASYAQSSQPEEGSVTYYAELYEKGKKCQNSGKTDEAIELFKLSAQGNNTDALMALARYYYKKDNVLAEEYGRRGVDRRNKKHLLLLGQILYELDKKEEALQWFTESAKLRQGQAAYILGTMYENGDGVESNREQAEHWYNISAGIRGTYAQKARESLIRMGESSFMKMISKFPIDRTMSAQKLYKKGHRWYKNNRIDELAYIFASAEKGYAPAQMEVARLFVTKYAKEKNFYDEESSKKWYSKAFEGFMKQVEEGNTKAMAEIGHIYSQGNSAVAIDIDQAEKYYRMGAEKGDNYCQLCLGQLLRKNGQKEEALKWLIQSAESGQMQSAFLVGQMYENGEGTPVNMTKAVEWYMKSANTENYYLREARNALKRLGQAVPAKK